MKQSHINYCLLKYLFLLLIGVISHKITSNEGVIIFLLKKQCYGLFSLLKSSHWTHDLNYYTCFQNKKYYIKSVCIKIWILKSYFDMLETLELMELFNWNINTSTANISQKLNCFRNYKHNKNPCDEKLIWWNSYNMHRMEKLE